MILRDAWYRYRPVSVRDGHGGKADSITGVTPLTFYGTMHVHDAEESIILEGEADVDIGDLIRLRED